MSLDLSFNDLTDLQAMMRALGSLPRLRLLVLHGNPLALVAHYRGFVIDSLAPLCVLDDLTVSPSEKHQFRGLSLQAGEWADGDMPGRGPGPLQPPPLPRRWGLNTRGGLWSPLRVGVSKQMTAASQV